MRVEAFFVASKATLLVPDSISELAWDIQISSPESVSGSKGGYSMQYCQCVGKANDDTILCVARVQSQEGRLLYPDRRF